MADQETFEILINYKYGGYTISKKAQDELLKLNKDADIMEYKNSFDSKYRTDPDIIKVFHELGDEFSQSVKCIKINKVYRNYIEISDYDGKESVEIDYKSYFTDNLKNILSKSTSAEEKLLEIEKLIN